MATFSLPVIIFVLIILAGTKRKRRRNFPPPVIWPQQRFINSTAISKYDIGLQFELQVYWQLRSAEIYLVFHDIKILSAQIDILVLHSSGIIIIECKNWYGTVFGEESWHRWLKTVNFLPNGYFGENKTVNVNASEMLSPIHQNRHHKYVTDEFLRINGHDNIYIDEIVVFSENADIRYVNSGDYRVININNLMDTVKKVIQARNTTNIMPREKYDELAHLLRQFSHM